MTEEEIKNGNRLIAEFMGGEFRYGLPYTWTKSGWFNTPANDNRTVAQDYDFKYHNSWDWLMPVVDKLESTGQILVFFEIGKSEKYRMVKFMSRPWVGFGCEKFPNTKIQAVYQAVIELITAINMDKKNDVN